MPRNPRRNRIGLQTKAICLLALIVIGVTGASAWFFHTTVRTLQRNTDQQFVRQICQALGLAAEEAIVRGDKVRTQQLIAEFVRSYPVRYAAIFSADERTLATSIPNTQRSPWRSLVSGAVTVASIEQVDDDTLAACIPIVRRASDGGVDELMGSIRVVMDTSETARRLAKARQRILLIGAAVILAAMPLGMLVVGRLFLRPIRQLALASRDLARGEFSTRCHVISNDELGELGLAFDSMASEIARQRGELISANEELENKVALRTGELSQANARLRDEMAEKEDFLRAVSHDLNAPLRNIAGMATMIVTQWQGRLPEEVVARLGRIQANVEVQNSLISELLELSRIRSRPERRRVVDLESLMSDLGGSFEYELQARGIELVVHSPLPALLVEKNRFRQVFQNLIDNAIKYMDRPSGGRIEIGARLEGGRYRITVADNGPGIPPEDQKRIFHVFRRGGNQRVPGRGVGLALVKSVVANYEGRVVVESEPGHGATFMIELPERTTRPAAQEACV
ncbi:MAG: HAMP domain-containing sensor histidine kinase [Planctomycetota bacterium]|nr:HAMP domain-containing sensor histidine kinase [Planctomycetota bacterium]